MLNYYKPEGSGVHTIRVTFMYKDYIGHIAFQIGGNCKGSALLDSSFLEYHDQDDIDRYDENDCHFKFCGDNDDDACFTATLKNAEGDELWVIEDPVDFANMIVGIEIAEYEPKD